MEREQPELERLQSGEVHQLQLLAAIEGVRVVAVLVTSDNQIGQVRQVRQAQRTRLHAAPVVHENRLERGQVWGWRELTKDTN